VVEGVEPVAVVAARRWLVADPTDIAVGLLVADRPRRGAYPVARQPEPRSEVDVLVEEKVILVESTHLVEAVAPDQHRSAAGDENVALRVVLAGRLAPAELQAEAGEGGSAGDEIDPLAVPAEDLSRRTRDVGRLGEEPHHLLEPMGIGSGVVIAERQRG